MHTDDWMKKRHESEVKASIRHGDAHEMVKVCVHLNYSHFGDKTMF